MIDLYSVFYQLENMGFYTYILPFLLIFTVIFAILEKTHIFGSVKVKGEEYPRTNINAIFSLILSLIVVVNTDLITTLNLYLSKMSFIIILAIMIMLLAAMISGGKWTGLTFGFAAIIAVGAAIWSLVPYQYSMSKFLYVSDQTMGWLFIIGLLVAVFFYLTMSSKPKSGGPKWKFIKDG
jgi:hypothetical protein